MVVTNAEESVEDTAGSISACHTPGGQGPGDFGVTDLPPAFW